MTQWIQELFLSAASLAFLECILPESGSGKFVRFVMALILLQVILHPVTQLVS